MDSKYTHLRRLDAASFDGLARGFADHNYQQCSAYAHLAAQRVQAHCEHVAIESGDELLGVAAVRIRSAPVIGGGVAYVAGGPLSRLDRADDTDRLAVCLDALRHEYAGQRGLLLRVLGPLGSPEWNASARAVFEPAGYRRSDLPRRYRTFLLPLTEPETLRAGCSKYWRRNLRRAERQGLSVHAGPASELLDAIATLHTRLRERKGFDTTLDASFCGALLTELDDDCILDAAIVQRDDTTVAGLISCTLGDTCIPLLLAADIDGLRSYAAYLLQWHSIVSACEAGARYYDLGGIDPAVNPGVFNFKKGLRGVELWAPGPFQAAPGPVRGALLDGAERLYRRVAMPGGRSVERHRPRSAPATPPQLRRGHAGDVDALMRVCRTSFPESLRWQLGGPAGRTWWRAVLQSKSSETWVIAADGEIQGLIVLVTDEEAWAATRTARRATAAQCLAAALRRPVALRTVLRRVPRPAGSVPDTTVPTTPVSRRTWIELIAVAPRHRGAGVGSALLDQAESISRRLNRRAVQLSVNAGNDTALRHYERHGFGIVHHARDGLVLAKPLPGLRRAA